MTIRPKAVGLSTHHSCDAEKRNKTQFNIFVGFAYICFLIPALVQSLVGAETAAVSAIVRIVLIVPLILYCFHLLLSRRFAMMKRSPVLPLLLIICIGSGVFIEGIHGALHIPDIINWLVTALVIISLWAIHPHIKWFSIFATFGCITALVALSMMVLAPESAYMTSEMGTLRGSYKSVATEGLLSGPFVNANTLGISMAFSIPFAFLLGSKKQRIFVLASMLMVLTLSVARTSLIAVGLMLAIIFLFHVSKISFYTKNIILTGVVGSISAVVVLLPLLNENPEFLTGRGLIWMVDLAAWKNNLLLGLGSSWFGDEILIESGISHVDHTSSHNLFVGWVTYGGLVYLSFGLIVLLFLFLKARTHLSSGFLAPFLYFMAFLATGIAESNWQIFVMEPSFYMQGFIVSALVLSRSGSYHTRRVIETDPRGGAYTP